jgi:hypothetical protein
VCTVSAQTLEDFKVCEVYRDGTEAPSMIVFTAYYISWPLTALSVGVTFGLTKKHIEAFSVNRILIGGGGGASFCPIKVLKAMRNIMGLVVVIVII